MNRGDSLDTLIIGQMVKISFCDNSASVVYACDGFIMQDESGLYIKNGIRKDYFKDIDGCYVFIEKIN